MEIIFRIVAYPLSIAVGLYGGFFVSAAVSGNLISLNKPVQNNANSYAKRYDEAQTHAAQPAY